MATHPNPKHLDTVPLGNSDREAIEECMVKVEAAQLKKGSDYKVDLADFWGEISVFVKRFRPWDKVPKALVESKVEIVYMWITKRVNLGVPHPVFLIPTAINSGEASIENQRLDLKSGFYLTQNVNMVPEFNCIAFMFRPNE